jgi:hypothetical protein
MLENIIILGMDKKILQLDRLKDTIKPVTMGLRVNPKLKLQLAKEASENKMTLGKFVLKILTNKLSQNNKPVKLKKMKNYEATRSKIKLYLNALKERFSTSEWKEYHASEICKEFGITVTLPQILKNEGYYHYEHKNGIPSMMLSQKIMLINEILAHNKIREYCNQSKERTAIKQLQNKEKDKIKKKRLDAKAANKSKKEKRMLDDPEDEEEEEEEEEVEEELDPIKGPLST